MRRRRLGLLGDPEDDDPMSGVANLFDTAMVFAVALQATGGGKSDLGGCEKIRFFHCL